jgi:hypothetical protein
MQHLSIRLPRAEHIVEAIGREVFQVGRHPGGEPVAGDVADPEIDKRAVAVDRDVADR